VGDSEERSTETSFSPKTPVSSA